MLNLLKTKPDGYEVSQIYEELSYAMETGDTKENVIDTLIAELEERNLVRLFKKIRGRLSSGNSFGSSVAAVAVEKTEFAASLIDGTRPEFLPRSFRILADLKERENNLQSFSFKTVSYPLVLLFILFILLVIITVFIMPQFAQLFADIGSDLPGLTQALIRFASFAAEFWYIPLFFLLLAIVIYKTSRSVRSIADQLMFSFPLFGRLYSWLNLNEFLNRMSSLRAVEGFEQRQILELASSGIRNSFLRTRIESTEFTIDLLHWLRQCPEIPPRVKRIVARNKDEDQTWFDLERYLDYQTRNLDRQVGNSLSSLVTVLTVAIYVVVGLFIISVYLPIFKLGSVV